MFPLNISTGLNPYNLIPFYIYYWDCLLSLLRTCLNATNLVFNIIKGEVDSKVFAHPQCTCLSCTIVAVNSIKIEERLPQRGARLFASVRRISGVSHRLLLLRLPDECGQSLLERIRALAIKPWIAPNLTLNLLTRIFTFNISPNYIINRWKISIFSP